MIFFPSVSEKQGLVQSLAVTALALILFTSFYRNVKVVN
jgi:hypothetical protein